MYILIDEKLAQHDHYHDERKTFIGQKINQPENLNTKNTIMEDKGGPLL